MANVIERQVGPRGEVEIIEVKPGVSDKIFGDGKITYKVNGRSYRSLEEARRVARKLAGR